MIGLPPVTDGVILCLGIAALCGGLLALVRFAEWALNREDERQAATSFERDFIAENADVCEQDTVAMLEEIEALLDDAIAHVTRLDRAAQ